MVLHAVSHFALAHADVLLSYRSVSIFAALLAFLVARAYSASGVPRVDPAHERSLRNRLILIIGSLDSSLGYALLTELGHHGARVVALCDDPASSRSQQLLQLARSTTGNEQIYLERFTSPAAFAKEWERSAAKRRGALGEEIGRQSVEAVLSVMREGIAHDEAVRAWALVTALETSLSTPTPKTTDGIDPGAGAGRVSIVTIGSSPFYAAAAPTTPLRPIDDASLTLHYASVTAAAQRRFDALHDKRPSLNRLVYLSIAPGLTRAALSAAFSSRRSIVLAPIAPVLQLGGWLLGQDATRAAQSVIWALQAPLQMIKDDALVEGVQPGQLYRDGRLVGCAIEMASVDLADRSSRSSKIRLAALRLWDMRRAGPRRSKRVGAFGRAKSMQQSQTTSESGTISPYSAPPFSSLAPLCSAAGRYWRRSVWSSAVRTRRM